MKQSFDLALRRKYVVQYTHMRHYDYIIVHDKAVAHHVQEPHNKATDFRIRKNDVEMLEKFGAKKINVCSAFCTQCLQLQCAQNSRLAYL